MNSKFNNLELLQCPIRMTFLGYDEMKYINEADILQLLFKKIPEDVFPNISSYPILNNSLSNS